jgi:hypothetical protein
LTSPSPDDAALSAGDAAFFFTGASFCRSLMRL